VRSPIVQSERIDRFMRNISERETLKPHYTTTFLPVPDQPIDGGGLIMGTIQYMSPQQTEVKDANPRSDIFAYGAALRSADR